MDIMLHQVLLHVTNDRLHGALNCRATTTLLLSPPYRLSAFHFNAHPTTTKPTISSRSALEPVWFWKPEQENGYMSQWTESPWEHEGVTYHTAEMWMMVQKAKLFGDEEIAAEMAATSDPAKHKSLGRQARGFNRAKWDENKLRIVEEGTWFKFTASRDAAELKKQLLETGERQIVEASPLDKIWGIGFGAENAEANRAKWGENLLGIALVNVRKRIVEQEKK